MLEVVLVLLYLSVQNFGAFYETGELSMLATREQRHGDRLARVGRRRVLPVAALYGPNAAGKSTLVHALDALRQVVVEPRRSRSLLPVVPNLALGPEEPTTLCTEILVDVDGREVALVYEVALTREQILTESLARSGTDRDTPVFERQGGRVQLFGRLVDNERAAGMVGGISRTQTVLGLLGENVGGEVNAAWRWFSSQLNIIYPSSRYIQLPALIDSNEVFADAMNHALSTADTGITRLDSEPAAIERLRLDPSQIGDMTDRLRNDGGSIIAITPDDEPALVTLDDKGDLSVRVLVTHHEGGGSHFRLSLSAESDGTRRFMHLLPLLIQLGTSSTRGVFIIDELENSLHPHLTAAIIEGFTGGLDASSRRQLIFTTHEVTLMRRELLRRDETWLVEKPGPAATLRSVAEFADIGVRKGSDLFSLYMSGRLGVVPWT